MAVNLNKKYSFSKDYDAKIFFKGLIIINLLKEIYLLSFQRKKNSVIFILMQQLKEGSNISYNNILCSKMKTKKNDGNIKDSGEYLSFFFCVVFLRSMTDIIVLPVDQPFQSTNMSKICNTLRPIVLILSVFPVPGVGYKLCLTHDLRVPCLRPDISTNF